MIATTDVCTTVSYLEDIIAALRDRGIPVDTGFVSANSRTGRSLTITLGPGPTSLSHATLSWQPGIGWSLTTRQRRPRHWTLPLRVPANPGDIAAAVQDLISSLGTDGAGYASAAPVVLSSVDSGRGLTRCVSR